MRSPRGSNEIPARLQGELGLPVTDPHDVKADHPRQKRRRQQTRLYGLEHLASRHLGHLRMKRARRGPAHRSGMVEN
jgi:hypothetical protein